MKQHGACRIMLFFPKAEFNFLRSALGPEETSSTRSRVLWIEATSCLQIEAGDIPALRAALNSYIRWAHLALKISDNASHGEGTL